MIKLTVKDVAEMTATERVDAIAKLSPAMAEIIRKARADGMSDLHLLSHFRIARDTKPD